MRTRVLLLCAFLFTGCIPMALKAKRYAGDGFVQASARHRRNPPARASAETGRRHTMNILLWVLQVLAALLFGASGVMKVFMFDKVSQGVPSFGALPRKAWTAMGI